MTLLSRATCGSCRAQIRWFKTPAGRSMPVDVEPSEAGTIVIEEGIAVVSPAKAMGARNAGEDTYMPHWATCPNANEHRKKQVKR